MKQRPVRIFMAIALATAGCSTTGAPSGSLPPMAPTATAVATSAVPTFAATPAASPVIAFRALDTPTTYQRSSAEALDGTTAVGWVQLGTVDEQPAVWDTSTGALQVLAVPPRFVHPNGDTFVRLVGISGSTAVGTGILGSGEERGQARAMAFDVGSGELRILDIPANFTQAEAHAISGTTAVGQVSTAHGEASRPVAWDTETGAVRILGAPADFEWSNPLAVSGETIVGIRSFEDLAIPVVWSPTTVEARDLDLLPSTADGIPRAVDGTTAVGNCCFGEEGTPRPLAWDTATGSVRELELPAEFANGTAQGVSGSVVIGSASFTTLLWDLATGEVAVLPAPAGYDAQYGANAISGRTIVGSACPPAASTSENPRCVAAAWTLP